MSYLKLSAFPFTVSISQVQSPKTTQLLTKLGRYSLKSSTFFNEGYKRSGQSESPIAVWCPWLLFPWIWSVTNPPWFINMLHEYSIIPHPPSYMCTYDIRIYFFYIIYHYINILLRYLSSKHPSIWFIQFYPCWLEVKHLFITNVRSTVFQGQPPKCLKQKGHHDAMTSWWFFTNPSEEYDRQNGFIFPKIRVENKKYLKPPPRMIPPWLRCFIYL